MIPPVMPTYAREDIAFVSGESVYLVDSDGRRYLDFGSGVAVTSLGHCHPHLVKALTEQAGALWHCSNLYRIPGQERLAERLVEASFADSVFFCNSGAEAVEGGLKMVRKYHDAAGNPQRNRVITFEGGFHGRTLATLAAAKKSAHMAGFAPMPDGFDQVAFGNLNELRAAITDETAAILVEPIQGEGGIRPAELDYLKSLRQIADEFGVLLFFDEVQTGTGRTGKLFAYEWSGIEPDVLAVAKGLGGGFPIGAVLAKEHVASAMVPGSHGSTFGGNPLAMAAANAVMDVLLDDGFLARVEAVSRKLWDRVAALVAAHPKLFEGLRGAGMMIGLQCRIPNGDLIKRLTANGMLAVVAGENVVRLAPPLILEEAHIDEAMKILEKSCAELEEDGEK
jgi:acetylornithine/N-succinyldiaminopimelate aminotransferase